MLNDEIMEAACQESEKAGPSNKLMSFDEAKKWLSDAGVVQNNGGLLGEIDFLSYSPGEGYATLDGDFSIVELEALLAYMKGTQDVPEPEAAHEA